MPKMKTKKAAAKRYTLTAGGKIKYKKNELAAHSHKEDDQAQEKPEKSRIPRSGSRVSDKEEASSLWLIENLEETGYA